jgi:hypothetical protein
MHKSATKCNETLGKWCKSKHGASKNIDTLETYHQVRQNFDKNKEIAQRLMPPPISHEIIQNKVTNTSQNSHVSMAEGKHITRK